MRHLLYTHRTHLTVLPEAVDGCDVRTLIDRLLPILDRFGGERLRADIAGLPRVRHALARRRRRRARCVRDSAGRRRVSEPSALDSVARVLGDALGPLADAPAGGRRRWRRWPSSGRLRVPVGSGGVAQGLQESATACSQLPGAVADLIAAAGGSDDGAIIAAAIHLGELIVRAGVAFAELGSALDGVIQGNGGLSGAQKARIRAIVDELPDRLLHLALIAYVEDNQPSVKGALELAGMFDDELIPADPADPSLPAHRRRQVRLDRLGSLLSDPAAHLADLYGFGTAGFDGVELFTRIKQMVDQPDAESLLIRRRGCRRCSRRCSSGWRSCREAAGAVDPNPRPAAEKDLDVSDPAGRRRGRRP